MKHNLVMNVRALNTNHYTSAVATYFSVVAIVPLIPPISSHLLSRRFTSTKEADQRLMPLAANEKPPQPASYVPQAKKTVPSNGVILFGSSILCTSPTSLIPLISTFALPLPTAHTPTPRHTPFALLFKQHVQRPWRVSTSS